MSKKNIFIALTITCLMIIFFMSCMSALTTEALSNKVSESILSVTTDYDDLSYENQMISLDMADTIVRASFQVLIFVALGLCLARLLRQLQAKDPNVSALIAGIGAVVLDELHQQLFTMGRHFDMPALILGCIGCLLGVLISAAMTHYSAGRSRQ